MVTAPATASNEPFGSNLAFLRSTRSSTSVDETTMILTQSGNVGIGTTDPGAKLEVEGSYGNIIKAVSGSQNITTNFVAPSSSSGLNNIISTGGKFNIGTSDAQPFGIATNNISRVTILSDGNVGIGTTSPTAAKLVVNSSTAPQMLVKNTAGGNAKILFEDSGGLTQNASITFDESGQNTLTIATGYQSSTDLNRINIAPAGDVGLTVRGGTGSNSGNVGIGTTSPEALLDVGGGDGTPASTQFRAVIKGTSARTLYLDSDTGGASMWWGNGNTPHFAIDSVSGGGANFWTYNGGWSRRMDITSAGNVGIGTTSPDYKLEVNGTLGVNRTDGIIFAGSSGAGYGNKITANTSNDFIFSTSLPSAPYTVSEKMRIANGGATTFTSTVTATNFINSSDERLKENIEEVCDNVVKANWKTFNFKTEKGEKRYGVIAQELEKTNPEFVREDSQGFKSVAYIDLLIAKIAELEARIQKLEK